jgi:hypothetical protein
LSTARLVLEALVHVLEDTPLDPSFRTDAGDGVRGHHDGTGR